MYHALAPITAAAPGDLTDRLRADLDWFFAGLGQGINADGLSAARSQALVRMNALSDYDLACMGLSRTDIPAFVFADLFDP